MTENVSIDLKNFAKYVITLSFLGNLQADIMLKTCWAVHHIHGRRDASISPE